MKIIGYPEILNYDWEILTSNIFSQGDNNQWCFDLKIKGINIIYGVSLNDDEVSIIHIINSGFRGCLNDRAKNNIKNKALQHMEEQINNNPALLKRYTAIPAEMKEKCRSLIDAIELNII